MSKSNQIQSTYFNPEFNQLLLECAFGLRHIEKSERCDIYWKRRAKEKMREKNVWQRK